MVVSDRVLVALGEYLGERGFSYPARLRDWSGVKGQETLVLDADEPEEHEGLEGVFSIDGVVALRVHARDTSDEERRDLLGGLSEYLEDDDSTGFLSWVNDSENERGLDVDEGLQVYEFRADAGVWEIDGKFISGKVEFSAMVAGSNQA